MLVPIDDDSATGGATDADDAVPQVSAAELAQAMMADGAAGADVDNADLSLEDALTKLIDDDLGASCLANAVASEVQDGGKDYYEDGDW